LGFNFNLNKDQKVGELRSFVKEHAEKKGAKSGNGKGVS